MGIHETRDEPDERDDPLIGSDVEVRSTNGILYVGVVASVRAVPALGDLFELRSAHDPHYRRLVHVIDRARQVRLRGVSRRACSPRPEPS